MKIINKPHIQIIVAMVLGYLVASTTTISIYFIPLGDIFIRLLKMMIVPIVFTSAGNPKIWTKHLQDNGIIVVHVAASLKFALKSELAGVDAVVVEGFEAGGHNGRDETTTLCLI